MNPTGVVKEVSSSFIKPRHLLVGLAVTAGTLFLLSRVVPGIGQFTGLNVAPMVPLNFWPFQPSMNGGSAPRQQSAASLADQLLATI